MHQMNSYDCGIYLLMVRINMSINISAILINNNNRYLKAARCFAIGNYCIAITACNISVYCDH